MDLPLSLRPSATNGKLYETRGCGEVSLTSPGCSKDTFVSSHLGAARAGVMVDVDQFLAKVVRVGVLEERLHEDQVVLLGQVAEMSHNRPVQINFSNTWL